jgi:hypothetical protein
MNDRATRLAPAGGLWASAVCFSLAAAGCGNLTAGGATGEAAVVVSGDAPDSAPAASVVEAPPSTLVAAEPASTEHDGGGEEDEHPEGELEAEFSLFLVTDDDELVPLTDGDVQILIDLEGLQEPEVADRVVAARSYTALRMVFSEIEVEVDAGLIIGGVPVIGSIDIDIETSLVVEKSLALDIEDEERVVLVVDLNAASWLQAVDPVARTVDPQEFADLIAVTMR